MMYQTPKTLAEAKELIYEYLQNNWDLINDKVVPNLPSGYTTTARRLSVLGELLRIAEMREASEESCSVGQEVMEVKTETPVVTMREDKRPPCARCKGTGCVIFRNRKTSEECLFCGGSGKK